MRLPKPRQRFIGELNHGDAQAQSIEIAFGNQARPQERRGIMAMGFRNSRIDLPELQRQSQPLKIVFVEL